MTTKVTSFSKIATHFTCQEGTYLIIIIFRYLLKMQIQFVNSVCVFQSLYRVQYYGLLLSDVFWNSKQSISHVLIIDSFDFQTVKKIYIQWLVWNRLLRFFSFLFLFFLSSPLAGKRDIVVTILFGVCACVRASVRPSGFVRAITCTFMHGFQNNFAQLLPSRRKRAI